MSDLEFHALTKENAHLTIPAAHKFIVDLAIHEKLEHEVKQTEQDLYKAFLETKVAGAFILTLGGAPGIGEIIGVAIYYYQFSTWVGTGIYLEDLFIKEAHRSKGYGRQVFKHLAKFCKENNYARLDWVVHGENPRARKMYLSLGARETPEWEHLRLEGEALNKLID